MTRKQQKWHILRKKVEKVEFEPDGEVFNFACCDCALVHKISIAIEKNGNIGMAFTRNENLTKQNRDLWKNQRK